MLVDSCYLLSYSVLTQLLQLQALVQALRPSFDQSPFLINLLFELPNNCIVSSVNNSSLYPVLL